MLVVAAGADVLPDDSVLLAVAGLALSAPPPSAVVAPDLASALASPPALEALLSPPRKSVTYQPDPLS